jgi:hypothetical protein
MPLFHEYLSDYRKAAFVENVHLRTELGFARGWDHFSYYQTRKHEVGVPGNADRINDDVVDFLDAHAGEKVVIWVHYFDVHWPYGPIDGYGEMFLGKNHELVAKPYTYAAAEEMVQGDHQPDELLAKDILPGLYRAGLRAFDDSLGDFLGQIEARGLLDPALVVITSDHGDEFFEHGSFGHGHNLYDTTVRIPLLVKLPNQKDSQAHSSTVSLSDIGSTILDACGKDYRKTFPGRSLLPILRGVSENDRTAVFELVNHELENMKGIADSRHKLIVEVQGDHLNQEIFEFGNDFQPLDMSTTGDRAGVLRTRLFKAVRQWDPRLLLVESVRDAHSLPEEIENVDEIIDQLKAIGYIDSGEN